MIADAHTLGRMRNQDRPAAGRFIAAAPHQPMSTRMSPSGLVLPGIPETARMLGLTPVPEPNAWLDNLTGVYLVARDYLVPLEAARGRPFDRDQWITALLAMHPAEEYLCQLAALNHATNSAELAGAYQQRFLDVMPPASAEVIRKALVGGADGRKRWFLARHVVLRAMRLVLVPPPPKAPDPRLVDDLKHTGPETAAVLLAHLAADGLTQERRDGEPRFCGTAESLAMEMICNSLFNHGDDIGDLLARYRLLWVDCGGRLTRVTPRRPPADLLQEATGISFGDMTALAFAYWSHIRSCGPDDPVKLNAMIMPSVTIGQATIQTFLDLFSSTPAGLAAELSARPKPWQMLPIQNRPLLRLDGDVVVLDERYLVERVTRGLHWLVHDYEKWHHGENARTTWNTAYGEMVELYAEDRLRPMAPPLIGGERAYFSEEDLQAAFPGTRICDAGIDFGGDVVLAEVVSGTVKVPTREQADPDSFRDDTNRLVVEKVRQLYVAAGNLLRDPQPKGSPLAERPARIFPVVIFGGQYPVNPLTRHHIGERLDAEGLRPGGAIQPLTLLDLEELEACAYLHEQRNLTLPQLIDAWRQSPYAGAAFRNYLSYQYGGQQLGRPAGVAAALAESASIILQRLGTAPTGTLPLKPTSGTGAAAAAT